MTLRRIGPPVIVIGAILVAWEVYCRFANVSPVVLPAPSRIIEQLWVFRSDAVRHAVPTLVETGLGLLISIAVSIAAAVAMDRFLVVRSAIEPLFVASQTVPIVAIAPLMVLWFGFGLTPKILVVVLVTFFPVTIALLDGFAAASGEATDLLRSLGAGRLEIFRKLRWPAALPSFFTGLRIAATYGVIGAVFGEYVGAYEGLGIWMQLSQNAFRTDLVFGAILLSAALSVALFGLVRVAERLVIPWYGASRAAR